jgi:segregation and condensation protein A
MEQIHGRLIARGQLPLSELFRPGMHKSSLISIFLAVLELVRHHGVRAEQNSDFGEIWLIPGAVPSAPLDLSSADNYEGGKPTVTDVDATAS